MPPFYGVRLARCPTVSVLGASLVAQCGHCTRALCLEARGKHFGVRPEGDASHPERTRQEYCIYDEVHRDYVYTKAWVEKLAAELTVPSRYNAIVGWRAVPEE